VVVVVIVVAMEAVLTLAGNAARPAETGARCLHAGADDDMASTLERRRRRGQQIHLQPSAAGRMRR